MVASAADVVPSGLVPTHDHYNPTMTTMTTATAATSTSAMTATSVLHTQQQTVPLSGKHTSSPATYHQMPTASPPLFEGTRAPTSTTAAGSYDSSPPTATADGLLQGSNSSTVPAHYASASGDGEYTASYEQSRRQISSVVISEQYLGEAPPEHSIRYVEVPVIEEVIKTVPVKSVVEVEKIVPRYEVEYVEKVVESSHPQIKYIDRHVEKPEVREVVREVKGPKQIQEIPREVIRTVPKIEYVHLEKVVEVPGEIIEVPKQQVARVQQHVHRPYDEEVPVVVAQTIRPIITESRDVVDIDVYEYEPQIIPVDVHVATPIASKLTAMGAVQEVHQRVAIPPAQYNSILRALNTHLADDTATLPYVQDASGSTTMLAPQEMPGFVPIESLENPRPIDLALQHHGFTAMSATTADKAHTTVATTTEPPQIVPPSSSFVRHAGGMQHQEVKYPAPGTKTESHVQESQHQMQSVQTDQHVMQLQQSQQAMTRTGGPQPYFLQAPLPQPFPSTATGGGGDQQPMTSTTHGASLPHHYYLRPPPQMEQQQRRPSSSSSSSSPSSSSNAATNVDPIAQGAKAPYNVTATTAHPTGGRLSQPYHGVQGGSSTTTNQLYTTRSVMAPQQQMPAADTVAPPPMGQSSNALSAVEGVAGARPGGTAGGTYYVQQQQHPYYPMGGPITGTTHYQPFTTTTTTETVPSYQNAGFTTTTTTQHATTPITHGIMGIRGIGGSQASVPVGSLERVGVAQMGKTTHVAMATGTSAGMPADMMSTRTASIHRYQGQREEGCPLPTPGRGECLTKEAMIVTAAAAEAAMTTASGRQATPTRKVSKQRKGGRCGAAVAPPTVSAEKKKKACRC